MPQTQPERPLVSALNDDMVGVGGMIWGLLRSSWSVGGSFEVQVVFKYWYRESSRYNET